MGSINGPGSISCQLSSTNGRHQQEVRVQEEEEVRVEMTGFSPCSRGWVPPHLSLAPGPLPHPPFPGLGWSAASCWVLNLPTPLPMALLHYTLLS